MVKKGSPVFRTVSKQCLSTHVLQNTGSLSLIRSVHHINGDLNELIEQIAQYYSLPSLVVLVIIRNIFDQQKIAKPSEVKSADFFAQCSIACAFAINPSFGYIS